jgi:hypothetical protein
MSKVDGRIYFMTDGHSDSMSWYLAPMWDLRMLSEICSLISVERPLWREDGSAICSVITQWSESLRNLNNSLLSHLRLPQFGVPSSLLYPPESVTLRLTVIQTVCLDIRHPCGTCDQILLPVGMLLSEISSLISVGRPLWLEDGSAICSVITQWS